MHRLLADAVRNPRMNAALTLIATGVLLTIAVGVAATPFPGEAGLARAAQCLPGWLEPFFRGIRSATGTEAVTGLTLLLAGAVALAGQRRRALCLIAAFTLLLGTQSVTKNLLDRPRPSETYVDVRDDWTSPSYPSGHAMGGTFVFVSLALLPRLPAANAGRFVTAGAAMALAGADAVANVSMGVHWPTDVAGGMLFGSGFALAAAAMTGHAPTRQTG